MGDSKKHHYVPEVYLKRFCFNNSGEIFTYKAKPHESFNRVRRGNKSSICYSEDFYRFTNSLNIIRRDSIDLNIIEDGCFGYESNRLTELFDKIESQRTIFKSELEDLVKIILSIKTRNPAMLEVAKSYDFNSFFDSIIDKLEPAIKGANIPNKEKLALIPGLMEYKAQINESSDIKTDLYRHVLLKNDSMEDKVVKEVINRYIKSKILILKTDVTCPFITCDNPGFAVDNAGMVYNTDFNVTKYFYFPVSPFTMIFINFNVKQNDQLIQRDLTLINIGPHVVLQLNRWTLENCNQRIFSNSEDQLNGLRNLTKY